MWTFTAELWEWDGKAAWVFVTVPPETSDEMDEAGMELRRGFGSLRVRAKLGPTTWETSVFPSKEHAAFILPVKKAVREAAGVEPGDRCEVTLALVEDQA